MNCKEKRKERKKQACAQRKGGEAKSMHTNLDCNYLDLIGFDKEQKNGTMLSLESWNW